MHSFLRLCRNRQVALRLGVFVLAVALAPSSGATEYFKNSKVPALPTRPASQTPEAIKLRADNEAEHQREMRLLNIKKLRPERNGTDPTSPLATNYDQSLANPYPRRPDVLKRTNGQETTTAKEWWTLRRPELVKIYNDVVYGRTPKHIPKVTWEVTATHEDTIGGIKVVTKDLVGHVDNAAAPSIQVDIKAQETLPAGVKGHIPMIIELGYLGRPPFQAPPEPGPDWKTQLLQLGWGFTIYDPTSVQADNAAGLKEGIIGLVNQGKPRSVHDWGGLKAWAWGASRVLDYLAADPHVASDEIGIAGHSRFGAASLVTEAYDPRIAIGYISSGGARISRRNYGQPIENMADAEQFNWMAATYMKFAADPLTANDLPVDGDDLLALCAPRPIFVSVGSAEAGDGWADPEGTFMAVQDASAAWRLLGKQGAFAPDDKMPPVNTAVIGGDLGFRQHAFGHTQTSNWPTFLQFAQKYLHVKE